MEPPRDLNPGWGDYLRFRMAAGVVLTWVISAILPLLLFGPEPAPIVFWAVIGLVYAYMGYSGIRALRKGWRSRFILRVVIPLSILAASMVLVFSGIWRINN